SLFPAPSTMSHAPPFPGLFAPTGLLGAGPHSTAWLYMFWHGGFPLAVIAYALLKDPQRPTPVSGAGRVPVLAMLAVVLAVVGGFTVLATIGHGVLPALMQGNNYTTAQFTVITSTSALS